ncbi:CaiB/BaiF CoA-transferase family protein [Nocardioides lentus]|uniref:CaiB/BaiF CoA-transferase family protein n=1 Tax=Nocardioides lentus TaxID=338077 RepID=A0ABN2P0X1_9ACTN
MGESPLGARSGPLRGVKVVEIAGIGPGPHACTILADLGADVVRLERPGGGAVGGGATDLLTRGRPSVALDLKHPEAAGLVLDLVASADVLVEGMRPGTTERLGIGPEQCWERNPALVYGRMTGWGQDGPLASTAGHDMNYVALTGALHGLGQDPGRPHFPMNLLGDFGGGSTYLVIGVLAALLEARTSGRGQVVDAAITDGTAHLNAMTMGFLAGGGHVERRASNFLDGGQPYYDLYATADGRHMSVGPLEPQFYALFTELLGIAGDAPDRFDPARADELRTLVAARFAERTMAEWTAVFEGTDACVAPVLTMREAAAHPHNVARGTLVEHEGLLQPGPAPRFSATPGALTTGPTTPGSDTRAALTAWGVTDVEGLLERGVVAQA